MTTNKHRQCVTHHHACDCREAEFETIRRENQDLRALVERLKVVTEDDVYHATDAFDQMATFFTAAQDGIRRALTAHITRKLEGAK